jgi:hypothetical protein
MARQGNYAGLVMGPVQAIGNTVMNLPNLVVPGAAMAGFSYVEGIIQQNFAITGGGTVNVLLQSLMQGMFQAMRLDVYDQTKGRM